MTDAPKKPLRPEKFVTSRTSAWMQAKRKRAIAKSKEKQALKVAERLRKFGVMI
jgi:hypothetical protein